MPTVEFTRSQGSADDITSTVPAVDTTGCDGFIAIVSEDSAAGGCALSDNKSNTWTLKASQNAGAGRVAIWECKPTTVGAGHTFTATGPSSPNSFPTLTIIGLSSFSSYAFDTGNTDAIADTVSSPSSINVGNITPSAANAFVVTGLVTRASSISSISGGFTLTVNTAAGAHNDGGGGAYLQQTTPASTNAAAWTLAGAGGVVISLVCAWKPSSTAAALAATPAVAVTASAAITAPVNLRASAASAVTASANLTANGPLKAAATTTVTVSASLDAPIRLVAAASIAFTATALFGHALIAQAAIGVNATAVISPSPRLTTANITLDGVAIQGEVRKALTIRDILNDAPNTATLSFNLSPVPSVSQRLRITLNDGLVLLFAGSLQTVDRTYEGGKPLLGVWPATAIDDTARANARRPFGTFVGVSATTVGQGLVADFAPDFSDVGIAADLPEVTITFDGNDTFIGAFARIAQLIGGYTKIEDGIVYLFLEDTTALPDPVDATHPPLNEPPIRASVDVSQLRTRVYGKGYGENVPADVGAGETIIPIEDGVNFNPNGGQAITGTTADGAQHQVVEYDGVVLSEGGTLVGPGAAPANPLTLALAVGAGVTGGVHDLTVVHVTAAGKTLPSPIASLDVGQLAAPSSALVANTAVAGSGPDQGSHDYQVTNVGVGGETTVSPISNAITTNAAVGQISAPGAASASNFPIVDGNLNSAVVHSYKATFVNATGETEAGAAAGVSNVLPPSPNFGSPSMVGTTGGSLTAGQRYRYFITFVAANGYETELAQANDFGILGVGKNAINLTNIPTSSDPRVTKRRIYRSQGTSPTAAPHANGFGGYRVHEINDNVTTNWLDTISDVSAAAQPAFYIVGQGTPGGPQGTIPGHRNELTSIPIGPAGVTARKIYRQNAGVGDYKLITTISNNTATTHTDNLADGGEGAIAPTSNTTGSAVQQIPLTGIPIGPGGTTSRKLYRRFNGSGSFKLVTTIANNTATTYTDSTNNAGLGANAPSTNTTSGNQIAVSAIPIGSSTVTAREIYMSPAGGGARKRALLISNNTDTTATITMSDATLAGEPAEPTSDTSGLTQPTGQVNPGSTSLPVASSAPFSSSGGWVVLGQQVVRYTGITGQALSGIPASGEGSIFTTVLYGQQALPSAALVGVTGVVLPMLKGSAVNIWVQRDDLLAQAEQAARDGTDGVVEYILTDERRTEASLIERCDADLALFARPIVTVTYHTRDVKTKSGKPVTINLVAGDLVINETLTIQEVTISEIDIAPNTNPRFAVTASSVRFSLEDMLRRLVAA